ncbi:MAG: hypothetical protein EOO88_29590 [Pedobacter sp.]|nr:MAG: hypothetical protein EOO88_29590 [Pedobacter sp.]
MKNSFLVTAFLLISLISRSQVSISSGGDLMVISRNGYSIQYPATWRVDTSHAFGTDVFIASQKEGTADKFVENVNVLIQNLPPEISSLEQYVAISEQQIKNYAKDGELIRSLKVAENGHEYHVLSFYHTQNALRIRADQYYFVVGSKAYVVTFSMEKLKESEYSVIANRLLKSFTLN